MSSRKFVIKIMKNGATTAVGEVFNPLSHDTYYALSYRFSPRPNQQGLLLPEAAADGTLFVVTTPSPLSAWSFWGHNQAQTTLERLGKMGITGEIVPRPLRLTP